MRKYVYISAITFMAALMTGCSTAEVAPVPIITVTVSPTPNESDLQGSGLTEHQTDGIMRNLEKESGSDQQVGVGPTQDAQVTRTSLEAEYNLWCAEYAEALGKLAEFESAYTVARANGPKDSPAVVAVATERNAWIAEVRLILDQQYDAYIAAAQAAGEGVVTPAIGFSTRETEIILGTQNPKKLYCARG